MEAKGIIPYRGTRNLFHIITIPKFVCSNWENP
jgi:hypothetical protein